MNALLRAVRRLASLPLVNRLTRVTPLLRLSFALRSSLVKERGRFIRNELRRKPTTAVYHLRESRIAVAIRHHSGDVMVLDEIFSQREYELPAPVERALADVARPLAVLDLGANIGLFGAWILGRFPDARVVAFEADPGNADVHRRTIDANYERRWQLVEGFAATRSGRVAFAASADATSHESRGEYAVEVESVDVFDHMDGVDFLKIDIEGSEWPLLADPRFRKTPAQVIVLEYHRDGCPEPDPAAAAAAALERASFEVLQGSTKEAYGAGVLWGVRRSAQLSA